MNYGEIVDDYNPQDDYIYSVVTSYFQHPSLTKIKNQDNYSMWACKIYTLLANQFKYIIAFTHIDHSTPMGTIEPLKDIKWVNLQTRTLTENIKCNIHSYTPSYDTPLKASINRINVTKESSIYSCQSFPTISINLLHNNKKDKNTYQNEGTIVAALETYETILSIY